MADKLRLAPHERASPLWISLERHMRQSLAELRALNDTSLPPDRTEHIRGRIAQLKALLALADEPQQPPT